VLLDAAPSEPAPFVAPPPAPAVFGARELSTTGRRALADALLEHDTAPQRTWSSVDAAVRAWVRMRDEGASMRSTSDPDRVSRVQTSNDPSLGGREHDAIERTATVASALDRAERWYPMRLAAACDLIDPHQARAIYLLSVAGVRSWRACRSGTTTLKGGCYVRVPISVTDVADRSAAEYEQPITWRHVVALRQHFGGVVMDALVGSGEMKAPRVAEPRRGSFAAGPSARVGTGER